MFVSLILAALIIPQTSERTVAVKGLDSGAIAFEDRGDGTASMWVGGDTAAMPVEPPYGLRAFGVKTLGPDDYAPSAESGITFDGTNTWTWSSLGEARLVLTCKSGTEIEDVTYHVKNDRGAMDFRECGSITNKVVGNLIYFEGNRYTNGTLSVTLNTIKAKAYGKTDAVNDLTKMTYMMRDSLGELDLCSWRHWLIHCYDGNRGEDWAKYLASDDVSLNGNRIRFDAANQYIEGLDADTNLVMYAAGREAVKIVPGASENISGAIRVTNITVSAGIVTMIYTNSISNFATNKLEVQSYNDGIWSFVPASSVTHGDGFVRVATIGAKECFYRLLYGGIATETIKVVVNAQLHALGGLYIKGTDGVVYRIDVVGGVISATAVNQ